MFTQAVLQKSFTRLSLVEAMMGELVGALAGKGVVEPAEIPGVVAAVQESALEELEPDEEPIGHGEVAGDRHPRGPR